MSTLRLPEQLVKSLRTRYTWKDEEDGSISYPRELAEDHKWTIYQGYSEWSGYHDEDNYHYYSVTIADHELPREDAYENYRGEILPENMERLKKQFQGYEIVDGYTLNYSKGYGNYYYHTYFKLLCTEPAYAEYTNPLWVLQQSDETR